MGLDKTIAAALAELDGRMDAITKQLENAVTRSRRHYLAAEDAKARLANTLELLQRAEANNARMSVELRHAHREIAQLESERDTWRAAAQP